MDGSKADFYGGFSVIQVILSDVLPTEAFHPDHLKRMRDYRNAGSAVPDGMDDQGEKKV